jgi:hypothetical protein
MRLQDFAEVVRSKNAGPRRLTLDIIFRNDADYHRAAESNALTAARLAALRCGGGDDFCHPLSARPGH